MVDTNTNTTTRFPSKTAVLEHLGSSNPTVTSYLNRYVDKDKLYRGRFKFYSASKFDNDIS